MVINASHIFIQGTEVYYVTLIRMRFYGQVFYSAAARIQITVVAAGIGRKTHSKQSADDDDAINKWKTLLQ